MNFDFEACLPFKLRHPHGSVPNNILNKKQNSKICPIFRPMHQQPEHSRSVTVSCLTNQTSRRSCRHVTCHMLQSSAYQQRPASQPNEHFDSGDWNPTLTVMCTLLYHLSLPVWTTAPTPTPAPVPATTSCPWSCCARTTPPKGDLGSVCHHLSRAASTCGSSRSLDRSTRASSV